MNYDEKIKLVYLIQKKASELKLTGNEELMVKSVLTGCTHHCSLNTQFNPLLPGLTHHRSLNTQFNPLNHLVNTFHAIIIEKFPDEYKLIHA